MMREKGSTGVMPCVFLKGMSKHGDARDIELSIDCSDQFIDITEDVHAAIECSSVTNGTAIILSHTTCGIVVNEGLPCVETDLMETSIASPHSMPLCTCTSCRAMEPPATTPVGISRA
ncbi:MAG: YjbQ family protein [Collinsella sp.]